MANTYTQIHIQAVICVKYRQALIQKDWKTDLYRYLSGIIQHYNHKVLAINGIEDHVHLFFGFRPDQALSDLMRELKRDSTKWINKNKLCPGKFSWQTGFGDFSYCKSEVSSVINYIHNQEIHHQKRTFRSEYIQLLKERKVDYDERYIFQDPI